MSAEVPAYPLLEALPFRGNADVILGFRSYDRIILESDFKRNGNNVTIMKTTVPQEAKAVLQARLFKGWRRLSAKLYLPAVPAKCSEWLRMKRKSVKYRVLCQWRREWRAGSAPVCPVRALLILREKSSIIMFAKMVRYLMPKG